MVQAWIEIHKDDLFADRELAVEGVRVISFRKANQREVKRYEETQP